MVAIVVAMEAMVATARGLLMPSPRLRLSLSPDMATGATAMAATDAAMAAMVATAAAMVVMAATATARGLLMPSPGTAMVATATGATAMAATDAAMAAMVATVVATTDKFATSAL